MNNLNKLSLLEEYISKNGYAAKFTVPFLQAKSTVELQNWKDYQDLRQGIITFRQSGIRVKSPNYYPCLTHIPNIPIIYDNGYRYLNSEELLTLQSFPLDYTFPSNYSLKKIACLLGNSANVEVIKHFVKNNYGMSYNLSFIDLFCGIGAFHQALINGNCILAIDNNKSCQATYQLNFPTTPFLLGDINNKELKKKYLVKKATVN